MKGHEVAAAPRDASAPLSFAQHSAWMVLQLGGEAFAHNLSVQIGIRGALDVGAVHWSLREVVRRHEMLRTTFPRGEADPVQVPHAPADSAVELAIEDLSELADPLAEASERAAADLAAPFDLESGPPFRFALRRLAPDWHVLQLTLLRMVGDDRSMAVVLDELSALYRARIAATSSPLPDPGPRYADHAAAQRARVEAERERLLGYWREQLAGVADLDLPTDRPRPEWKTFAGRRHTFAVPAESWRRLVQLGRQEQCTELMSWVAVCGVLLARWAEQEDVAIGAPVSTRGPESERTVGPFLNTLVLRCDFGGNPTFRDVLRRVRDVTRGALEHREMPIEELVRAMQPTRDLSRNPLFQVTVEVAPSVDPPVLGDLEVESEPVDRRTSIFDLSWILGEDAASVEYGTELFDAGTIERLSRHLLRLIDEVARDPEQRIWQLSLSSQGERERLLRRSAGTRHEYEKGSIHGLFERQAARTPRAAAVQTPGGPMTFEALEQSANRVAHHLIDAGVEPGAVVGICLERSAQTVAAILGVLKAGAAYLPLDPGYPAERLAFMIENAKPARVITDERGASRLPRDLAAVVRMDRDAAVIAERSARPPALVVDPDSAAYVLYTSGSSGRPKGVVGRHRAVVNRCSWMRAEYPFRDGELCCHKTSLSWVDSTWEIFAPLLAGVPLVVFDDETVRDTTRLLQELARHRIVRLVLVPSLLRAMLEVSPSLAEDVPELELWLCGGEEMSSELAERFRAAAPDGALLNMYGFSEYSADVTVHDTREGAGDRGGVPIGRPIWNTRVYLLDPRGELVLPGAVGEICVGGDGLAQGYLHQPGLTAEKFVPDPFSSGGGRLYHSGDLGRWRSDGVLEYLGRRDRQAKVRGYRIELAEIDHVLAQHPAVAQCAVLAHRSSARDTRLAAFAVLRREVPVTVTELRAFLRERLPDYMVPQMMYLPAELPQQPNGKIDHAALARTVGTQERGEDDRYLPPQTETEKAVASIWQEELEIDRVGRADRFLDLGGDSLQGVRVLARMRSRLKTSFWPADLFVQNLGQIAATCDRRLGAAVKPGVLGRLWRRTFG